MMFEHRLLLVALFIIDCKGTGIKNSSRILAKYNTSAGRVTDLFEDRDGYLLVSGLRGLAKCDVINGEIEQIQMPNGTSQVSSTIVTSDGTMWSATLKMKPVVKSFLYQHKVGGSWEQMFASQIESPQDLALDPKGRLVVLDAGYWRTGGPYLRWVKLKKMPIVSRRRVVLDQDRWSVKSPEMLTSKKFALIDSHEHCVLVMNREKELLQTLGQCGTEGSAPGQLYYPFDVTFHEDKFIVADTWNHRLSVFGRNGGHLYHITGDDMKWVVSVKVTSDGKLVVGTQHGGGAIVVLQWSDADHDININ